MQRKGCDGKLPLTKEMLWGTSTVTEVLMVVLDCNVKKYPKRKVIAPYGLMSPHTHFQKKKPRQILLSGVTTLT